MALRRQWRTPARQSRCGSQQWADADAVPGASCGLHNAARLRLVTRFLPVTLLEAVDREPVDREVSPRSKRGLVVDVDHGSGGLRISRSIMVLMTSYLQISILTTVVVYITCVDSDIDVPAGCSSIAERLMGRLYTRRITSVRRSRRRGTGSQPRWRASCQLMRCVTHREPPSPVRISDGVNRRPVPTATQCPAAGQEIAVSANVGPGDGWSVQDEPPLLVP